MTAGFADLRSFLDHLRRDRDVVEITAPVDAAQEAAEIHRRVIAAGGPALLFTNVRGSRFPLVTNLFGTARRAGLAFGTRPHALIEQLVHTGRDNPAADAGEVVGRARAARPQLARVGASRRTPTDPSSTSSPTTSASTSCRSSRAGPRMAARSSRCRSSTPSRRTAPATTSACTGSTSTIAAAPGCTGRSARAAASTTRRRRRAAPTSRSRSSSAGRRR